MQKSGTGLSRSHHVVFEDSLNHRSEHFDHNARPRSLPTVLQHTRSTGVNKEALLIICNIYDRRNVFSIRCTRAHLTEELAQIRWRVVVFQKRSDGLHKTHMYTHKRTHTGDYFHIISLIYTGPEPACCQVKELCENRPQVSYTNIAISLSIKLPLLCPVTTAWVSTATVENTQIKKI